MATKHQSTCACCYLQSQSYLCGRISSGTHLRSIYCCQHTRHSRSYSYSVHPSIPSQTIWQHVAFRENATAMYMTLRSVISGLHEDYLIRISFDHEDDITITLPAVWATVRDALETLVARIARIVIMLSRKESYIIETYLRRK